MSFVASQESYMPFKSVSVKSTNGLSYQYSNNSVIRIKLDHETIPYLDPRSSALKFDLVLAGTPAPKVMRRDAFAAGVIDTLRIMSGNGEVLEEVTNYSVLAANMGHFENDSPEIKKKSITEGAYDPNDPLTQPYFANDGAPAATSYNTNTFLLPLRYSGILSNRGKVVPLVATGGLFIEIFLAPEIKAMSFVRQQDKKLGCRNNVALPDAVTTTSTLDIQNDAQDINRTGLKPLGLGLASSTWKVGQQVEVFTGGVTAPGGAGLGWGANVANSAIATSALAGAGAATVDRVTCVGACTITGIAVNAGIAAQRSSQAQTHTYTISNVEYVCGVIDPPPSYKNAVQRALASKEGFMFDIKSFQEYRETVDGAITTASINIPLTQSRIYSIFTIPTMQEAYTAANLYDSEPVISGSPFDLSQYQLQYSGKNHPSRRVSVDTAPANQNVVTTSQQVNNTEIMQQHYLFELEKALENADIEVRNLRELQYNFVIGRALSKYGETYDGINRDFLLNLYWTAAHDPVLLHSFVCHLRRIHCTNEGVVVEV